MRTLFALFCALCVLLGTSAAAAATKKSAPKKKAVPTMESRLAALGIKTTAQRFGEEKKLTNRYGEVPPTTKPARAGTRRPPAISNHWTVVAQPHPTFDEKGKPDAVTRGTMALVKAMREKKKRRGGLIVVFLDPTSPASAKAFAQLVASTQRTVTSVICSGMPADGVDCRDAFASWGMPRK